MSPVKAPSRVRTGLVAAGIGVAVAIVGTLLVIRALPEGGFREGVYPSPPTSSPALSPSPNLPTNGDVAFLRIDPESVLPDGGVPQRAILLVSPDGTNVDQLVDPATSLGFDPAWSPDGSQIALSAFVEGRLGIFLLDPYAHELRRLTEMRRLTTCAAPECQGEGSPSWSPDGQTLIIWRDAGGQEGLWSLGSDGSDLHIVFADFAPSSPATWSPDGGQVAVAGSLYDANHRVGTSRILILDTTTWKAVRTIQPTGLDALAYVAWSPDSQFLAFSAVQTGSRDRASVYLVRPDGTGLAPLASGCPRAPCSALDPSWAPDSHQIVFTLSLGELGSDGSSGDLFTIDVVTGKMQPLTGGPGLDCCSTWQTRLEDVG
jgi:Tol biopolymer transport system component